MHVCYSGEERDGRDLHTNYDAIFFTKLRKNFDKTRSFGEKLLFRLKQIDFVKVTLHILGFSLLIDRVEI